MPARLNEQLRRKGLSTIDDRSGSEPVFARVIFESLAERYGIVLRDLERLLGKSLKRIYILGGGGQNRLLTQRTEERTGLSVETGDRESSTVGNLAVQLASAEAGQGPVAKSSIRSWARRLSQSKRVPAAV
jgi:rhamnulokinase